MAFSQFEFISDSLRRVVSFNILLPNDSPLEFIKENENYKRGVKTLFLLHGYSGNNRDWILESKINEFAIKYNIAVVFPNGDNSFYLDGKGTGSKYGTYVGEELVNYTRRVFGLSNKKEDTYIGGFSMGGFGAIPTALKYNETFSKAIALSSALIINEIKNKDESFSTPIADYYYYERTFGNLNKLEKSENNPEELIRRLKSQNKSIPSIFMACGREDFLIDQNREFHKFLIDNDVNVYYKEDEGNHNWEFWNKYLEPSIQWLLN
mgnify:FL=1